jgi:hypothetical protein
VSNRCDLWLLSKSPRDKHTESQQRWSPTQNTSYRFKIGMPSDRFKDSSLPHEGFALGCLTIHAR